MMRRNFSPLFGLLMAAIMLAAIPAALASPLDILPRDTPTPPVDIRAIPVIPFAPAHPVVQAVPESPNPDFAALQPAAALPNVDERRPSTGDPDVVEHDRPSLDHAIKLRCVGSVYDLDVGSVECNWTVRDSLEVDQWQLWNVRVRPDHGERNLVAELRPDVTSYVDRDVETPGHYLYAVLGLNAAGEIIARSAVAPANLVNPPVDHGALRLKCRPAAHIEQSASVGCEWSRSESEDAVGYVMWRSVDGGDRVAIARTGLDVRTLFDTDVSMGHRYTYVITVVDAAGEVVGRSRPEQVGFPGPRPGPEPRPVPVPLPGPEPRPVPVPLPGPEPRPVPVPRPGPLPHPVPAVGAPTPSVDVPAPARVGLSG